MVKICKFLLLLHNYKLYSALKYSNPKREINILTLESQLPFLFTFLVMTPSAFLSIRRNNFSIWVSSPKNSSKESLPSKSLSFSAKNFSISFLLILISLKQRWAVIFINEFTHQREPQFLEAFPSTQKWSVCRHCLYQPERTFSWSKIMR